MTLSVVPQLLGISVPKNALSTILSIILFLSVIPLIRAADALSENKMHSREVREYLDNVGKHYRKSENSDNQYLLYFGWIYLLILQICAGDPREKVFLVKSL
jgi:hypothetical protein